MIDVILAESLKGFEIKATLGYNKYLVFLKETYTKAPFIVPTVS